MSGGRRAGAAVLGLAAASATWWAAGAGLPPGALSEVRIFLAGCLVSLPLLAALTRCEAGGGRRAALTFSGGTALTALWLAAGVTLATDGGGPGPAAGVLGGVFVLLAAGLLGLERGLTRPGTPGLLALGAALLLLLSPFCLEAFFAGPRAPGVDRGLIALGMRTSPVVLAAEGPYGLDLFKAEAVYARFRVGEQLYSCPRVGRDAGMLGAAALALFALGLIAYAGRSARRAARIPQERKP